MLSICILTFIRMIYLYASYTAFASWAKLKLCKLSSVDATISFENNTYLYRLGFIHSEKVSQCSFLHFDYAGTIKKQKSSICSALGWVTSELYNIILPFIRIRREGVLCCQVYARNSEFFECIQSDLYQVLRCIVQDLTKFWNRLLKQIIYKKLWCLVFSLQS